MLKSGIGDSDHDRCQKGERINKKILIVEDDAVSRMILRRALSETYDTLEAENGQQALDILNSDPSGIALIVTDLVMPVMDGYTLLKALAKDPRLSAIPVIVTSSENSEANEIQCLENGAVDFMAKPYRPEIVKRQVDNIVHLQEASALLHISECDPLTGLYNKEYFSQKVERLLELDPVRQYDMAVANVENFKVINERLGVRNGDRLLRYLADCFRSAIGSDGLCARLHSDVFAILIPHGDGSWKDSVLRQWGCGELELPMHTLVIKYGVYENVDRSLPASGMWDRAKLALNRIKKRYGYHVTTYDDSLRTDLLREQQILDTMEQALDEHQFQVYYQPKYDITTGQISGAEALVRWQHPELGLLPPGAFIPLFERNGFISKLDYFVWEETCRNLRKWKDEGRKPIPVSANVSRLDFAAPNLAEQLIALTDNYGVERNLLHLEVTESAYMDEPKRIAETLGQLRKSGFKIEMDDFGSGYSSLNMLSNLPVDVLKLDMRFVQDSTDDPKSILGFVISLSKWMELDTIAEGVETQEQVDKLKQLGCNFAQGYYYAKPMPREDFECRLEGASEGSHTEAD